MKKWHVCKQKQTEQLRKFFVNVTQGFFSEKKIRTIIHSFYKLETVWRLETGRLIVYPHSLHYR